jgi:hypothetical protein
MLSYFDSNVHAQLPFQITDYIATVGKLKTASFNYVRYHWPKRPSDAAELMETDASKIEHGSVAFDVNKAAYFWDFAAKSEDGEFSIHRTSVLLNGVSTKIFEDTRINGKKSYVIGSNSQYFCPLNILGIGLAFNNDLAVDPDALRHLPDVLLSEEFVGVVKERPGDVFEFESIGVKKRYSGPWRTDLIIALDPGKKHLPAKIELRARNYDNANVDTEQSVCIVKKYYDVNGFPFPIAIELNSGAQGPVSLWIIDEQSIRVNESILDSTFTLDLAGMPGVNNITNVRTSSEYSKPSARIAVTGISKQIESVDVEYSKDLTGRESTSVFRWLFWGCVLMLICGFFARRRTLSA